MFLTVRRSGGFAGLTASGELETTGEPDVNRLEAAAHGLDQARLGTGRPQADRYVYRLEVRTEPSAEPVTYTVAEQDLDETTAWLLDRILTGS
ncbi:hypothetical protein FB561_5107 [Kribbella amoyensis]|uniref:Uncharacterized protein n=1 Tax=Kribbella amoyensis TaxID=996641 RepID=A0A561BYF8_9ACTN|nr:hypothetical protein FB561_5107 [Kribbella amoyensis]